MSQPITGEVIISEPDYARERAMAKAIVTALGDLIEARTSDLPHRFKAPSSLKEYFDKFPVNTSMYHQVQLGNNYANPMLLQITTRPSQNILELIFQGADGMRLFTLEIEYGDRDRHAADI